MNTASRSLITVIIPTWNRAELLCHCLESLERQTARCRVLVVDNGSTDATLSMMRSRFPDFGYLRLDANQGFAKAANRGLAQAETPLVALLNNDTEADPRWLEAGIALLETRQDCGVVASRILNYWRRDHVDSAGDCYSRTGLPTKRGNGRPAADFTRIERVLGASAGAAFYRRDVLDVIGGFDEDFHIYLEDVDLSLRACLAGFVCLYCPEAIVYHMEGASDPDSGSRRRDPAAASVFYSDSRVFWITRNRWRLMITYQPWRNTPWLVYGWTRSFLFHLLKAGHWPAFMRGLASGIATTGQALRKRGSLRGLPNVRREELWRLMREC
jgi:GT2 family glycosyltransferase